MRTDLRYTKKPGANVVSKSETKVSALRAAAFVGGATVSTIAGAFAGAALSGTTSWVGTVATVAGGGIAALVTSPIWGYRSNEISETTTSEIPLSEVPNDAVVTWK